MISWTKETVPAFLTKCLVIYSFFLMTFFHQLFLYDSTMIAPFPLLFFGGEISVFVEEGYETIAVDDFIKFKSPTRIANLVKVGIICWISLIRSRNTDARWYPLTIPRWLNLLKSQAVILALRITRKLHQSLGTRGLFRSSRERKIKTSGSQGTFTTTVRWTASSHCLESFGSVH